MAKVTRKKVAKKRGNDSQVAPQLIRDGKPDRLTLARYERPSKVRLHFADGVSRVCSFQALDIDPTHLKPATIKASASGADFEVKSKRGETIRVDASSLRALIDPDYAAVLEKSLLALRGPIDALVVTARKRP